MTTSLTSYCKTLLAEGKNISAERKHLLEKISAYIAQKLKADKPINLVYICTHNSRRSHFGQVWAHTAAAYFNVKNVRTFSGGTEATAFNANAIAALKRAGFVIKKMNEEQNAVYHVYHDEQESPSICFSKVFNHPSNPETDFAAIMTCSDAEENCPYVPGTDLRIATTYNDPKAFDNTPLQDAGYDERCRQIGAEIFYIFSKVV